MLLERSIIILISKKDEVIVFFSGFLLQFIFSTLPPPASSFDTCEEKFFTAFYQSVDTIMVGGLLNDFKEQIRTASTDPQALNGLLQQLPFEPDNLRTGDCTFSACCNILMLNEYLKNRSDELLDMLGHVAVLTYFRHSISFFSEIFHPTLERCAHQSRLRLEKTVAEYYQAMKRYESAFFSGYRKAILTKMAEYITKKEMPVLTDPGAKLNIEIKPAEDGGFRVVYTKATPRIEKKTGKPLPGVPPVLSEFRANDGIRLLLFHTQTEVGRLVEVTREFGEDLVGGCVEVGKTRLYDCAGSPRHMNLVQEVDVAYRLDLSSKRVMIEPPVTRLASDIILLSPSLVLQIPTVRMNPDPTERYLIDQEAIGHKVQVHSDLVIPENAARHALVANFYIAATQNTWFSANRGLRPSTALSAIFSSCQQTVLQNFAILCSLSIPS